MALGPNYRRLFAATTISNLGDGVGLLAYPWLASAVTRNPVLIALVTAAQRLPWLVFTLPAGVIVDRGDRRRLMVWANAARAVLTMLVALAVLARGDLPGPDEVDQVLGTDAVLYLTIVVATLLLGMAEVIYDNSAQTFMPAIVAADDLERANGRMYSAEIVANQFAGPPLASALLAIGFAVPFFLDAGTFAVSAALIFLIAPTLRPSRDVAESPRTPRPSWRAEIGEGFRWLWHHELFRPMAIILGVMNGLSNMAFASFVLFGQEVLGTTATEFAIMSTGAAVGGVFGGWCASAISRKIGSGPSLWLTLGTEAATSLLIGLVSSWPLVWVLMFIALFAGVLWNVITVSLRQAVIPDRLLGRVNSVYRFFAWGMIPIGTLAGGAIVALTDAVASRELALRMPWFVCGAGHFVLLLFAFGRLTTTKLDGARAAARAAPIPSRP